MYPCFNQGQWVSTLVNSNRNWTLVVGVEDHRTSEKPNDRLSVIWKSYLSDKIKCNFFQAMIMFILLYGCTTWRLTKWIEKKLDSNISRNSHQSSILKTIQIRRTRYVGHCWRSKDKLISDVLLWTPSYGCTRVEQPARTSTIALYGHRMLHGRPAVSDGW